MNKNNPVTETILKKQETLNEENQLIRKKKRINLFSLATSFLLLIGIIITIVRTVLEVMK